MPGLRRGVVRLPGVAGDADDRGDADDAAVAALHHAPQRRAGQAERRLEVDRGSPSPSPRPSSASPSPSRVRPALLTRMSRPPIAASARPTQRVDRGRVRQVRRRDMGALAEVGGQRRERLLPRAGERHGRALRVQGRRDRAADAAAGAGDERTASGQVEHHARALLTFVDRFQAAELPRQPRRPWRADCARHERRVDALREPGQHLAGADLDEPRDALRRRATPSLRASAPCRSPARPAGGGSPPDRWSGRAATLATSGTAGATIRRAGQRLGHRVGRGLHQRAVERRGDAEQHRPLRAASLGDLDRRARPRPCARR